MESLFSRTVKSGKTTYFIDVKEAKNKNKYIVIAESTFAKNGDDKKFTRKSIIVFDNAAEKFRDALGEAIKMIADSNPQS